LGSSRFVVDVKRSQGLWLWERVWIRAMRELFERGF
jgi:hypothetical protein